MGKNKELFESLVYRRMQKDENSEDIFMSQCLINLNISKSQVFQDILVMHCLDWKKGGTFVDIGAASGVELSNTFMLEKLFDWSGVLVEPSPDWQDKLHSSRLSNIDKRCAWSKSGESIEFSVCSSSPEYSTIKSFKDSDNNASLRNNSNEVYVETVSLNDLIEEWNLPETIDYLSLDTEGSELEILSSFNFSKYKFNVITVEHNFVKDRRERICELLKENGYHIVMGSLSMWDDWFIHDDVKLRHPNI